MSSSLVPATAPPSLFEPLTARHGEAVIRFLDAPRKTSVRARALLFWAGLLALVMPLTALLVWGLYQLLGVAPVPMQHSDSSVKATATAPAQTVAPQSTARLIDLPAPVQAPPPAQPAQVTPVTPALPAPSTRVPARSAAKVAPVTGGSRPAKDADADLIEALVRNVDRGGLAAAPKPGATNSPERGPAPRQSAPGKVAAGEHSVAVALRRCENQGLFARQLCRWRACDGHWGSVPECPRAGNTGEP